MKGVLMWHDEMHLLINLVRDNRMTVEYPLYDFELLRAVKRSGGYRLDMENNHLFRDCISMFTRLREEVPDYQDFRSCMMSSGVFDFANIDSIREKVETYGKLGNDTWFALDTNMLYHGFVGNHPRLINPRDVLMVDTVKQEIRKMMNKKYRPEDLDTMKNCAMRNGHLLDELRNKNNKRSRKAFRAYHEWDHLVRNDAKVIPGVREPEFGEGVCDGIIVDTLVEYKKETKRHVVLLTADNSLTELCGIEGLEFIKCDIGHRIDSMDCDYQGLANLLYDMAGLFGFIKFGPAIIYGEFGGRSSNQQEMLKVVTENVELQETLERELETCRKLKEIGIAR